MRLHLLSKKVIELGLPIIILVEPLLINPYGQHFYELPQVAFLRFAVLLLLTAWLVDRINLRGSIAGSLRQLLSRPLVLPTLLFTLAHVLSTITSVAPYPSFWGSFLRVYGAYNVLCHAIFFFLIILKLRTDGQLEQLITVALLASLPVALYGVLQRSGFDPIFPKYDHSGRVISTMGNPIFLGAYLIMVIPLAFGRLLVSLRALTGGSQLASSRRWRLLEVIGYSSLLVLQLVCLLYTKSRGPWFGLLSGALLFAVLIALRHRVRWLLFIAIVAGAVLVALLAALNLPHAPLEPFIESPYLSRLVLSDYSEEGRMPSVWVRLQIWQGVAELIRSGPNIGFTPDPLRPLRLLIGYGPETMGVVYPQVYPPDLAYLHGKVFDRAHNELLDLVVTTGALGLLAFLLLVGSFFYYGGSLLRRTKDFKAQITLIALLSAMFAHLVEAQFGILVPSVGLLLWLYLALVSVMYVTETTEADSERTDMINSIPAEASTDHANRLRNILSLLVVCVIPFFASLSNANLFLADLYLGRGVRFQNAGRWKESVAAYDKAIQVSPGQSRLYAFKASAYFQLAQNIADDELETRSKLLQASVDALARARELEPLKPEYYANAGKICGYWAKMVDPSKLEQAVEFYEQARQLSPRDAVHRDDLGRVYFDTGHYEESLRQLQLSLEIDPKFFATHYNLGLVYVELGDKNKAEEHFETALQLCLEVDPKSHATHYNLGLVYLKLGEKDKAEEHFKTALLLDPECEECAQLLESLGSD